MAIKVEHILLHMLVDPRKSLTIGERIKAVQDLEDKLDIVPARDRKSPQAPKPRIAKPMAAKRR